MRHLGVIGALLCLLVGYRDVAIAQVPTPQICHEMKIAANGAEIGYGSELKYVVTVDVRCQRGQDPILGAVVIEEFRLHQGAWLSSYRAKAITLDQVTGIGTVGFLSGRCAQIDNSDCQYWLVVSQNHSDARAGHTIGGFVLIETKFRIFGGLTRGGSVNVGTAPVTSAGWDLVQIPTHYACGGFKININTTGRVPNQSSGSKTGEFGVNATGQCTPGHHPVLGVVRINTAQLAEARTPAIEMNSLEQVLQISGGSRRIAFMKGRCGRSDRPCRLWFMAIDNGDAAVRDVVGFVAIDGMGMPLGYAVVDVAPATVSVGTGE